MGRKVKKATPQGVYDGDHGVSLRSAQERTLGMFSTRDRAPGVTYVPFDRGRPLLTTKPGNALVEAQVREAIVRIAPEQHHTDDEIETLKNVLMGWGAARVIVLPKPRDKVLPEKKQTLVRAKSLRLVVQQLVTDSSFDNKEALGEFVEEILSAEGL